MNLKLLNRSVAVILALSMIGCGQGYKSSQYGTASAQNLGLGSDGSLDTKPLEAAAADAQVTIDKAQLSLDSVMDKDGNVTLFNKSAITAVFEIGKIKQNLMKKLDAVIAKVSAVKAKFNLVRATVVDQIAKLDSTLPGHAAALHALNESLEKLDLIESNFNKGIQFLVSKLDLAIAALDKVSEIAQQAAGSVSPILGGLTGIVADLLIDQIKSVISEFKAKIQKI